MIVKFFLVIVIVLFFDSPSTAETILILDSGHDPKFKGAISSCGKPEFELNDEIVQDILKHSSGKILLTRNKNEPPFLVNKNDFNNIESLKSRVNLSNQQKNDAAFISIHHDSVSARFLEHSTKLCEGLGGKRINEKFKKQFQIGFNIFLFDEDTERYQKSLLLARLIGAKLVSLGQVPSNYHYPTSDDCKSCRPLDINLGIWHQNLLVLRENKIPAILLEVGNLMDPDNYKKITSETFKNNFGILINDSIKEFDQYKKTNN